jgi:hypothetical protein
MTEIEIVCKAQRAIGKAREERTRILDHWLEI